MATVSCTYTFTTSINRSVQVNDILYYAPASVTTHPVDTVLLYNNIVRVGVITAVNRTSSGGTIIVDQDNTVSFPNDGDFIFFNKEASANNSHIIGYFAETKFENSSNEKIELFNISAEVFESSK
tara:strand:+ start:7903 stop:8277 length:375 start_codon:yes stop_codon:yes gene_type:complete